MVSFCDQSQSVIHLLPCESNKDYIFLRNHNKTCTSKNRDPHFLPVIRPKSHQMTYSVISVLVL